MKQSKLQTTKEAKFIFALLGSWPHVALRASHANPILK